MIVRVRNYLRKFLLQLAGFPIHDQLQREVESLKALVGRVLIAERRRIGVLPSLHDAEFKVFSQFGEDGIIQYLIEQTNIAESEKIFVEFGVENYLESNTRFLLINNNWSGLVLDQSDHCITQIQKSDLAWRHDLKSCSTRITRENVNAEISGAGVTGRIGLLSIDIDGNDYWVWEQLDCIDPVIVVIEYNSLFGNVRRVAVPYDPTFDRTKAHFSWLYWGASIAAIVSLGLSKNYAFVGANSTGNNLFFVKRDRLGKLHEITTEQGFVRARFRDSRNASGALSFLCAKSQQNAVSDLPVLDLDLNQVVRLKDIFEATPT